jgi:biofilm PGA synthesis protein PgaA
MPSFCDSATFASALLAVAMASSAVCARAEGSYDQLIDRARKGEASAVLSELQARRAQEPTNELMTRDLIVIASWADAHQLATSLFAELKDPPPAYVLAAVALSERRLGRYVQATARYRSVLSLTPDDRNAQAGLVLSILESDGANAADTELGASLQNAGDWQRDLAFLPLLEAQAIIRERQARWTEALAAWQDLLTLAPNNKGAERAIIFVASRLGAASIADDLASAISEGIEVDARTRLRQDRTAFKIRWGEVDLRVKVATARFSGTDRALAASLSDQQHPQAAAIYRDMALADRLVALRNRVEMKATITLFETTQRDQVPLPPYAISAAADAYLYEREPTRARDLYQRALTEHKKTTGNDNTEWQFSLIYALLECEQWADAFSLADTLVETTRPSAIRSAPVPENSDHARALLLRTSLRLYGDEHRIVKRELNDFLRIAPYNVSARGVLASWYSANGKTLAAHENFSRVLTEEPESLGARIGHTESLLAMRQWNHAGDAIAKLVSEYPESRGVQRLLDDWAMLHSPELRINAGVTRSTSDNLNSQRSTREWQIDASAYSAPLNHSTRLFAHAITTRGALADQTTPSATRYGIGLEYQREQLSLSGELHRRSFKEAPADNRLGAAFAVSFAPNDDWKLRANADSHTTDLAFRAMQSGTTARRYGFSAERRFEFARSLSFATSYHDFSDGNRRNSYSANWHEQPFSVARLKLDTDLSISGSRNSKRDVAYFNPASDFSTELTVAADWLSWRHYERSFKQQLAITAGIYKQSAYSVKPLAAVSYTHEWSRSRHWGLRYGVSWLQRPYDGVQEQRTRGFVEFNWRLR